MIACLKFVRKLLLKQLLELHEQVNLTCLKITVRFGLSRFTGFEKTRLRKRLLPGLLFFFGLILIRASLQIKLWQDADLTMALKDR